ncbi:MAG TPA: penicillin-binding protein 1C [Nevskia sp.]|nr:penicillin-binding protein 1C [Nevskia sp.]
MITVEKGGRLALTAGAALLLAAGAVWHAAAPAALPGFAAVRAAYAPTEAYLLDRNGALLQAQRQDYSRRRLPWVRLDQVSPALAAALIQAEDRRFERHGGVDWRALLGAGAQDSGGGKVRGASTLTMQLAAQLDPSLMPARGRRSPLQKLRQMRSAWALEARWSKPQILEAYLNLVSFRGELQGVNTAAQVLFGKAPSGLTADESWLLAALLPAPGAVPAQTARRACALMRTLDARADCAGLAALAARTLDASRGVAPEADFAPQLARRLLSHAGERRRSTVDLGVQRLVIAALTQQVQELADRNVRDAAAVVLDNASGEVLGYVGSVALNSRAPLVDGVRAPRQAGSTLKPFLYGLALEKRYLTAASLLDDSPVKLLTSAGLYIPQDYDRDFRGLVSVRSALAGSLNVPAVRAIVLVGPEDFLERLRAFGYDSIDQPADYYGYSLALGSAEVDLLEQANAYRALANGGLWSPLRLTPEEPRLEPRRVMSPEAAWIVGDILSDRGSRAVTFGLDSPLATPFWSAVKTGTSKFMRDNWCIGWSQRYTVAVWVGNFDGEPMRGVSGVSGAAPAWLQIMTGLQRGSADGPPSAPQDVVATEIHYAGGTEPPRREWFLRGTELASVEAAPAQSLRPRLESPPAGMIVGLDPDIPADRQQVLFRAEPRRASLRFELDGRFLARADREYFWAPRPGAHVLRLLGEDGKEFDRMEFSVRGQPPLAAGKTAAP